MRYSPVYDTWTAICEKRAARPKDYEEVPRMAPAASAVHISQPGCPFCEGNEYETPGEVDVLLSSSVSKNTSDSELDRYRKPNSSGWMIRAVPNRFPFLEADPEHTLQHFGPHIAMPNTGKQEVLVEVPFHEKQLAALNGEEFQYLIHFCHRRIRQLQKEKKWRYVQFFKNQGPAAGASLEHLHSQIAALRSIPPSVCTEQTFLTDYAQKNGTCWHCEVLKYELAEKWRLVEETAYFAVFCPFASRFAGEIHIVPKRHVPCFVQSRREELDDLAEVLQSTLRKLEKTLSGCDFNLVLRTSPWTPTVSGMSADENFHWRLEICPRITRQAGFELGTGCFVNPIAPETMAAALFSGKKLA